MRKLSTGQDSTLGVYRDLVATILGEASPATKYLDEKIADSPKGRDEEVLADESQMLHLIKSLHANKQEQGNQ